MSNQSSANGKLLAIKQALRKFREDRSAKIQGGMLFGLFAFGLIIYLIYSYVYPWWISTVSPALGFLGAYATAGATIILFMLVGYGLIRYGKGHKGLPA